MIKKFDLYIIKKYLVTYVFILILFSLISVVFDASEKVDKFVRADVPFPTIVRYYVENFIPFILNLTSPIFIFIAALLFTSKMAYNSEIIPVYAAGVSFWRVLVPYLWVAFFLTGADLYFKNYIIPNANAGFVKFESTYFKKGSLNPNVDIHRITKEGEVISLERYHAADSFGSHFSIEHFDGKILKDKLRSSYLKWDKAKKQWYAHHYTKRTFDEKGERLEKGDTLYIDLAIEPGKLVQKTNFVTGMTTPVLIDFIEKERKGGNPSLKFFEVELYQRFSVPFTSFILIMIAYALASRKIRGGTGMHMMLGILLAFTFIALMRFSVTFGQQSNLDPMASVWLPNIFFFFLAIYLMIKAPK